MTGKPQPEDHAAAAAMTGLLVNGKRGRDDHESIEARVRRRVMNHSGGLGQALPKSQTKASDHAPAAENKNTGKQHVLRSYPYFFYRDFSTVPDSDPLTPLTTPGRVPNFPAKMHSILSRPDLADIVSWMPHGRAWRVLKPREFEVRVIPTYFEHAKFSSFIRQANGWGFRRITQGRDRNCYYHELFLRGVPHLCKIMKRPGVAEKQAADPDHEPDFYKIGEAFPLPEKAPDDSILLQCTLQGGPKARMPIYLGPLSTDGQSAFPDTSAAPSPPVVPQPMGGTLMNSSGMYSMPQTSLNQYKGLNVTGQLSTGTGAYGPHQHSLPVSNRYSSCSTSAANPLPPQQGMPFPPPLLNHPPQAHLHIGNMAQSPSLQPQLPTNITENNPMAPADPLSLLQTANASAASQFAAGFAAATALNNQQFCNMLGNALASIPPASGRQQQSYLEPMGNHAS